MDTINNPNEESKMEATITRKPGLLTKFDEMTVAEIKAVIRELWNDFRDGADTVIESGLSALESRLPEAEFVRFCELLEA